MRIGNHVYLALSVAAVALAADSGAQPRKDAKHPAGATARAGIPTPGVQIPFASLKAEAEIAAAPEWIGGTDSLLLPNAEKGTLDRLDPKTNKPGDAIADLKNPCGGAVTAFGSIWVPRCDTHTIARLDPKTFKITASAPVAIAAALPALAATADSVWVLTDNKTTLSRVDPDRNAVVAELRLPAGCNSIAFGESALWVTCPSDNRVLRVNPQTNLVEKYIDVSDTPESLAIGENSIWVYCRKEGKVERIDPKTNKSAKIIETSVPGAAGAIAVGLGSVWVTQEGFPLTRIDPAAEKVVQQFYGAGGGALHIAVNALWLTNRPAKTLWRIDPKRVAATLAE